MAAHSRRQQFTAHHVLSASLRVKTFFKALMQEGNQSVAPEGSPESAAVESRPETAHPPLMELPPTATAADSDALALELGDFITRIPEDLLRPDGLDLHRPLLFDLETIANRLGRGISTIPLSEVMDRAPEIFEDATPTRQTMEIRFPWQRVIALIHESETAAKEHGGESLTQKLRRQRDAFLESQRGEGATHRPAETLRGGAAKPAAQPSWFSRTQTATTDQPGLTFPAQTTPGANQGPPPGAIPATRNSHAIATSVSRPALTELPPTSSPATAPQVTPQPEGAANSGLQRNEQRIVAQLEAKVKELTAKHQNEMQGIRSRTDGLIEKLHAKNESALQSLVTERDEAIARSRQFEERFEHSAGRAFTLEAEIEMRIRAVEQYEEDVAQYRARIKKVLADHAEMANEMKQKQEAHANGMRATQELLSQLQAERDKARAEADELHVQLATQNDALHESKPATAAVRNTTLSEAENFEAAGQKGLPFKKEPASATTRSPVEFHLERQQIVAERDAARAELRNIGALVAARTAVHERMLSQWEADADGYRKRLQLLTTDRAALETRLRDAENALPAKAERSVEPVA